MVSGGRLLNGGDELSLGVGVIVTVLGVDAGIDELGGADVVVPGDVVGELQRPPAWRFWLAGHESD